MIQKIKNSWLYEKLNNIQQEDLIIEEYSNLTLKLFLNSIVTPLLAIFLISAGIAGILLLPFGIFKDIVDVYYHKHEKRLEEEAKIKAKIQTNKDIEQWLLNYQRKLDSLKDTYYLKQKVQVEYSSKSKLEDEEKNDSPKFYVTEKGLNQFDKAVEQHYLLSTPSFIPTHIRLERLIKNTQLVKLEESQVLSENANYSDFIKKLLTDYNSNCFTFSNKNNNQICDNNRRRSMYDIYLITKHYYPEVTFEEIVKCLILYVTIKGLKTSYCTTVKKYVFYRSGISEYLNLKNSLEFSFSNNLTMHNLINYFNEKQKSNVS